VAEPAYQQIAEDLQGQIETGALSPGERLPTKPELGRKYQVSRNTVRDAVKLLITRGLVQTRPGDGTFVNERTIPFITTVFADLASGFRRDEVARGPNPGPGRSPHTSEPRVELRRATGPVSAELQIEEGTEVVSRQQQRWIDGAAWSLRTSFYPMRLVEQGAWLLLRASSISEGAVSYLEATLGMKLAGWRDRIAVRVPHAAECSFFGLPRDGRVRVIEARRTGFDEYGRPFVLIGNVYPADRNELVLNVGQTPAAAAGRDE
jgi:GntR family transcriptional regulator